MEQVRIDMEQLRVDMEQLRVHTEPPLAKRAPLRMHLREGRERRATGEVDEEHVVVDEDLVLAAGGTSSAMGRAPRRAELLSVDKDLLVDDAERASSFRRPPQV